MEESDSLRSDFADLALRRWLGQGRQAEVRLRILAYFLDADRL